MRCDLIVRNADIITMDPRRPRAHSIAIASGRIVAVDDDVPATATAGEVIDAGGATVLPGFNDVHNHMAWYGLSLVEVDLTTVGTLEGLYARVEEAARATPPGRWVVGAGYDHHSLGGHPDRQRLDAVSNGRPVWLKHRTGHLCTVNTAILEVLGLMPASAPDPVGGLVVRDAGGRPTGLLEETAQGLVQALILPYSVADLADAIARASKIFLSEGITSVTEAGIGGGWIGKSPIELAAYQAARDRGDLGVRVQLMVASDALHDLPHADSDQIDFGLDLGIRTGFGDDRLSLGAMKIFMDGSLLGHTAALCSPYEGHPENVGYLQQHAGDLVSIIGRAHRSGWQIAAHAIGDRAVSLALDAVEQAQAESPRKGPPHRLEHAGLLSARQVSRLKDLGVIAVPQAQLIREFGDAMLAALGPERAAETYRHASLLAEGIVVPGSSDRPVTDGAPLRGVQAMVERLTDSRTPFPGDERISVPEALRSYTLQSAYAGGQERDRGMLAPGMLADLAFLGEDPTAVPVSEIGDIPVTRTVVGGEVVYER